MSRQRTEPKIYRNEKLMQDTNEMFIRIKIHLLGDESLKGKYPKPNESELNQLMDKLFFVLRKDNEPIIKR